MKTRTIESFSPRQMLGVLALIAVLMWFVMSPAIAGADTTFSPAFNIVTNYLEGDGGKIIAVLGLAVGLASMLAGFRMAAIMTPIGVGIGAGVGVPIVTAAVGATI